MQAYYCFGAWVFAVDFSEFDALNSSVLLDFAYQLQILRSKIVVK